MKVTLINKKDDGKFAIDTVLCPHCCSEMTRNLMDDPYTIDHRSYICHVCGAEEIVTPEEI